MQLFPVLAAAILLAVHFVVSNPLPQWNCGSCWQPRIERTTLTGEATVFDATQFIEEFNADVNEGHTQFERSCRQGRPNPRLLVTHRVERQGIDSAPLGNTPFSFVWSLLNTQPGVIMIELRPLAFNDLIARYSAVNNHVTVVSYRIEWRLHYWRAGHNPVLIPPIDVESQDESEGPQTIFYERATETQPMNAYRPAPASWYRDQFNRQTDGTPRTVRLSWTATIRFIR